MASVKFFPPPYINGRNVMRAIQNKSIFLSIRTCGRAVNWILKHGIYFNCSGWEKAVLRRFYVYDTVKKEELCTVGMLEEENIEL